MSCLCSGNCFRRELPAGVVDGSGAERLVQNLQGFGQSGGAVAEAAPVEPALMMLGFDRPAADSQLKPSGGYLIQRGGHLGEQNRVPELVAQHQMSDAQSFGVTEQRGGQGPGFQGVQVRRTRAVEVVVEPQRVDAELFTSSGPVQHLGVAEADLG